MLKKNLTANQFTIKKVWNQIIVMSRQIFMIYEVGSNYACSAVILIDSNLIKDRWELLSASVFRRM